MEVFSWIVKEEFSRDARDTGSNEEREESSHRPAPTVCYCLASRVIWRERDHAFFSREEKLLKEEQLSTKLIEAKMEEVLKGRTKKGKQSTDSR